jgi:hypothetical protein
MTKSTWNAVIAGGGLIATWFAVNPNTTPPARSSGAATQSTVAARQVTVDELTVQEQKLRAHLSTLPLRPSARNPFRFGSASRATPANPVSVAPVMPAPAMRVQQPTLSLSGMANDNGKRTAIITGDGQLYLAGEGDVIAGRYHVVTLTADGVTLRTDDGEEFRLFLR